MLAQDQGGICTCSRFSAGLLKRRYFALTFRTPSRGYSSLRGALGGGLLGSERGGPRGRCDCVSALREEEMMTASIPDPGAPR